MFIMNEEAQVSALERLALRLAEIGCGMNDVKYRVPEIWCSGEPGTHGVRSVDPLAFWSDAVTRILRAEAATLESDLPECWTSRAVVYNLFPRAALGFDHDGDGCVETLNRDGFRETGTWMKAISLLPWIRNLGFDTVHLLPVSRIGTCGKKGHLGSPYAVADPCGIDPLLSEPVLELNAEIEFRAFVQAAHRLGLRVVVEFVLRTVARDSAWVAEHPDWVYWMRVPEVAGDPTTRPEFSSEELARIYRQVDAGDLANLPPPREAYRRLFVPPPPAETLRLGARGWEAPMNDGGFACVPGAFADWPPVDRQPPWSDVAYLRLYDHPDFNYVAYNTIRMYDRRFAADENRVDPLWRRIIGILPYFIRAFDIDGAMIDMGHALPRGLLRCLVDASRRVKPSFAFWSEDFAPDERTRADGYDAAVGNYWWAVHRERELREVFLPRIRAAATSGVAWFAAPETHNTPRCASRNGGSSCSLFAWAFGCFLPAVPFLHAGFELAETKPINTGLDFSEDEVAANPETSLALYNETSFAWDRATDLPRGVREALALRREFVAGLVDPASASFDLVQDASGCAVAYRRTTADRWILVVGNPCGEAIAANLEDVGVPDGRYVARIGSEALVVRSGRATVELAAWACLVFSASTGRTE